MSCDALWCLWCFGMFFLCLYWAESHSSNRRHKSELWGARWHPAAESEEACSYHCLHQAKHVQCVPSVSIKLLLPQPGDLRKTSGIRMEQDGSGWIAVCFFHRPTPPTPLRALAKPQEAAARPKFSSSQLLSRWGDVFIMICLTIWGFMVISIQKIT